VAFLKNSNHKSLAFVVSADHSDFRIAEWPSCLFYVWNTVSYRLAKQVNVSSGQCLSTLALGVLKFVDMKNLGIVH